MSNAGIDAARVVRKLVERLGSDAVTSCIAQRDADPRTAEHVSGRRIGEPLCWVRPKSTSDAVAIVEVAREESVRVAAVGSATTFWDGLRVGDAIAVDATRLRAPFMIDRAARVAHVGAGYTIREVDEAARRVGLCVLARPDSAGDTPIGSLLAVGSTAGLGMGHALPIDLVCAATIVTGVGEIARLGASHAMHERPFTRHGIPDALGLVSAAEGLGALITEIGILLAPSPYIATTRARATIATARWDAIEPWIVIGREALDDGVLDTFRVEVMRDASESTSRVEIYARTFDRRNVDAAAFAARELVAKLAACGFVVDAVAIESPAARAGELPDYEMHWMMPVGEHRARLAAGAFWGVEATSSWGSELAVVGARIAALFEALAEDAPSHRRFAIYLGHHTVSIGTQLLARREPTALASMVLRLGEALPDLLRAGAIPYRSGHLWSRVLADHMSASNRRASRALVESLSAQLDPERTIGVRDVEEP